MSSELRRSFRERAKEKLSFGFRLTRPSSLDAVPTSSPDDPQTTRSLTSGSISGQVTEPPVSSKTMSSSDTTSEQYPTTSDEAQDNKASDGASPQSNTDKRKSRHLAQPKGTIIYEVSSSDTLASIAAQFDTTTSELKKTNKLMTSMVFPGQILYIPDKDYIPSEDSSPASSGSPRNVHSPTEGTNDTAESLPASGTESPKHVGKPAFDWKLMARGKGPGLAERQKSTESPVPGHIPPPSEDQVKQLDEECSERFIKVTVKHITDGQGVVSGVLLVTPNAIMFDPNVSDPLVIERGAEEYGMIAPMDTVISAAMYHDIAAMNKSKRSNHADGEKPIEVYHDKTCPLYKERVSTPAAQNDEKESDASPAVTVRHSESVCSCGAMDRSPDVQDMLSSSPPSANTAQVVMGTETPAKVGFTTDATESFENCAKPQLGESPNHVSTVNESSDQSCDLNKLATGSLVGEGHVMETKPTQTASEGVETECHTDSSSDSTATAAAAAAAAAANDEQKMPTSGAEGKCSDDLVRAKVTAPVSLSADMQIGNIQQRERSPEGRVADGCSPSPHREDMSVPRDSGGSPRPSSSPKDHGLLSRTLESLSSLGSSFPGSPNLSSLATGLFSWNQDGSPESNVTAAAQDDNDVFTEGEAGSNDKPSTESHENAADVAEQHDMNTNTEAKTKTHTDIEMESIVKLSDRPELFKDLSELVPRPATHYEDLPLYLCLRIGLPRNKKVSKTCPIESYMKQKHKPEYWFCIPRDKVDHLYAFFLRWSPTIYGSDDEINAQDRGFVVINGSEDEEDIDIIDDHFDKQAAKTRHITKDWEIVTLEEARRRMTFAEVENLPLPELSEKSSILNEEHIRQLCLHLPARAEGYPWTLIYSSEKHGFSLKTLYRTMQKIDCPVLIVVKDTASQVFGAMLPCAIVMSDHFYGTGESFLFTFYEDFKRFGWSGINSFFIKGNADSLSVGAGQGLFGLWLDGDLYHGRTQSCETFENDLLTVSEDFVVQAVEAWGFI